MKKLRRIISLFLTAVLCAGCLCFCGAVQAQSAAFVQLEGDGFDTPEDAVRFYLDGLKNLDIDQMLSAFAWETLAEHYSVETRMRYLNAFNPASFPSIPSDNDFLRSATMYSLLAEQTKLICWSIEAYILPGVDTTFAVSLSNDEKFDAFWAQFDTGRIDRFSRMGDILFLTPDQVTDNMFSRGPGPRDYERRNAMYGADEIVDVPAAADLGDEVLFVAPTVARYGSKWYIVNLSSLTSGYLGLEIVNMAFYCTEGSPDDLKAEGLEFFKKRRQ